GSARALALAERMTERWSRGPRQCRCAQIDQRVASGKKGCITALKPVQAWALYEMGIVGGLLAHVPVGAGKCLDPETEVYDYKSGRRRRLDESGDLRVATFDQTLRISDATAFPSGDKYCVEVALLDGAKIIASTDHPILTARGWIPAAELL